MRFAKVLAVLAAMLLVGSVAVATLGPQDMSLGDALSLMDHTSLAAMQSYMRTHLSAWLWERPMSALIARPLWLLPAALGLICAGGAATAASGPTANKSRRRRS